MHRCVPRELSSSNAAPRRGLTLVELLVTLAILSILAAAALPYAEIAVRRNKELELRQALRQVRTAIDRFNDDWRAGRLPKTSAGISDDGFPTTLQVLVDGVDSGDAKSKKRQYLRRIPRDPFADSAIPVAQQWVLRSYGDAPEAPVWSGKDVYDIRSSSDASAMDASSYRDW